MIQGPVHLQLIAVGNLERHTRCLDAVNVRVPGILIRGGKNPHDRVNSAVFIHVIVGQGDVRRRIVHIVEVDCYGRGVAQARCAPVRHRYLQVKGRGRLKVKRGALIDRNLAARPINRKGIARVARGNRIAQGSVRTGILVRGNHCVNTGAVGAVLINGHCGIIRYGRLVHIIHRDGKLLLESTTISIIAFYADVVGILRLVIKLSRCLQFVAHNVERSVVITPRASYQAVGMGVTSILVRAGKGAYHTAHSTVLVYIVVTQGDVRGRVVHIVEVHRDHCRITQRSGPVVRHLHIESKTAGRLIVQLAAVSHCDLTTGGVHTEHTLPCATGHSKGKGLGRLIFITRRYGAHYSAVGRVLIHTETLAIHHRGIVHIVDRDGELLFKGAAVSIITFHQDAVGTLRLVIELSRCLQLVAHNVERSVVITARASNQRVRMGIGGIQIRGGKGAYGCTWGSVLIHGIAAQGDVRRGVVDVIDGDVHSAVVCAPIAVVDSVFEAIRTVVVRIRGVVGDTEIYGCGPMRRIGDICEGQDIVLRIGVIE